MSILPSPSWAPRWTYAVEICARRCWTTSTPTADHKVILNLPTTVENCMPNQFADELEYFIRKLPGRERRHHLPASPQ